MYIWKWIIPMKPLDTEIKDANVVGTILKLRLAHLIV